ncbi:translation initiation factor 3, RNA-binding subunit, partial [Aureobasidium melanogenum]|uniref:Eukaryotic translation initiation factor 3 subunit G n=4 Tax=Aureobasidium TaxID=5579 RepID=A0A074VZU9_AURM1
MSNQPGRTDWAEDDEPDLATALPPPQHTKNKDGTETIVTIFLNEDGKKVKRTQRIRKVTKRTYEKAGVAERRAWPKMGLEAGRPAGPQPDTTTLGENIIFRPQVGFKSGAAEQPTAEEDQKAQQLKQMKIKCRICSGEHFTTKCPFKNTMAPEGEAGAGLADLDGDVGAATLQNLAAGGPAPGASGPGGSSYVPPHLRKGGAATGERMGGKFERDDLATLRVTNVSEFAEEDELRALFERFGRVTRVFLAKDRETGKAKGFAFVSFVDRSDAAVACEKMDGFGYGHLILRVEFAKKAT